MKDLIEALQIFSQYADLKFPTHCEHDVLVIVGIGKDGVSEADQKRLGELGFFWSDAEDGCWMSFRFGSA